MFVVGVDYYQFVWVDVVFFDYFIWLIVLDIDFGGVGDQFIFGNDVVCWVQVVMVKVIGGEVFVGYYDVCWIVLWFYMYGVKVKEGVQILVYIGVVLSGGWY